MNTTDTIGAPAPTAQLIVLAHALTPWQISIGAAVATITASFALYRGARALRGKKAADTLTVVAAAMASSVAATGMWHFFSRTMHLPTWIQAVLFAFMEIAVLASALRARANVARDGQAGADGLAVWVLTSASGLMSASEATSPQEALVRLGAPLVAAWLWERSMVPERRAKRAEAAREGKNSDGVITKITHTMKERLLASLGVTSPDQSALEIRQNRALDEVVDTTIQLRNLNAYGRRLFHGPRARRLKRRRADALRLSGVPQDRGRQQLTLDTIAVIQHADDLDQTAATSPWAAHRAEAQAPREAAPEDRVLTIAQLPGIVAAAVLLARRDHDPEPEPELDPADCVVTAGELSGIYATAYLLGLLHADRSNPVPVGPPTTDSKPPRPDPTATRRPTDNGARPTRPTGAAGDTGEGPTDSGVPTDSGQAALPDPTRPTGTSSQPTAINGHTAETKRSGRKPRSEHELQELADRAAVKLAGRTPTEANIRELLGVGASAARNIRDRLNGRPTQSPQPDDGAGPTESDRSGADSSPDRFHGRPTGTDLIRLQDPTDPHTRMLTRELVNA